MANTQQTLLDYLAGPALNELMMAFDVKRGLPGFLPTEFFKEGTTKPFTDKVIWDHRTGQRSPASVINYASPTPQFVAPEQQRAQATCLTLGEHLPIDSETVTYLKANVPIIRDRIERKVVEDIKDWKIRFENARNAAIQSALFAGNIAYIPSVNAGATAAGAPGLQGLTPTAAGQIVPSSTTGAFKAVDYALTYGGTNALTKSSTIPNATGSPTIGDWSSASTNIPGSVRGIVEGFGKTSNYRAARVLYGRSIPDYFATNTEMQTFMSRQPMINNQFETTNEVPKGLFDLDWYPAWKNYYVDYTGTVQTVCANNAIVVIPDVEESWYEMVPGGWLLPTGVIPPGMSFESAIMQSTIQNGQGSYMSWTLDPYQIKIVVKDCFLPLIKVPNAVWQITVS